MDWRSKQLVKLVLLLVVIGAAIASYMHYGLQKGLDLAGGAHIVLEAQERDGRKIDAGTMSGVAKIMERRVNGLGLAEANVQLEGKNRIIIELPAVTNPSEAIKTLGQTALLEFRNEAGETVMTGEYLNQAKPGFDEFGRIVINFELNSKGAKIFEKVTRENLHKELGIYLDGNELMSPVVEAVLSDRGQISANFKTVEEAEKMAVLLREGALPVNVVIAETRTVGPTLGQIAIDQSVKAATWGLIGVVLFMLLFYGIPGFIASQALAIYGVLTIGILAGLQATMTLPGIAGLILTMGMAVDANVIIFERIKEEMISGKTVRASIDAGFKRAFTAIFDSNATTMITALILAYFTSGTVRGFGITMGIGVMISMFTAITVTRFLMELQMRFLNNSRAFGVKGAK